mmetsp:Transcript_22472/g.34112  ORF Transcript_22472/g.34112 Transcript_22472/m.34112 type:complete len:468 (-) Transcript_22472:415-1818(-)
MTSTIIMNFYLRCKMGLTRCRSNYFVLRLIMLSGLVLLMVMTVPLEGTASAQLRHDGQLLNLIPKNNDNLNEEDFQRLNEKLTRMTLDSVLVWAYNTFGNKLVDVTSFGYSGMVILHKLQDLGILSNIKVVTIDTLHLFPETYQFIQTVVADNDDSHFPSISKKNFHSYQPLNYTTRSDFDEARGTDFWKSHPDQYNYISKVEPTLRALKDFKTKAWITGRRRDQGGERSQLSILEYVDGRYKLNPLAHWSHNDIWGYIRLHKVPYNPLHEDGYKSVGDVMTTQRVQKGDAERSGRFVGMGHTECGIHSTRAKVQKLKEETEQNGEQFDTTTTDAMPSLPCPKCDYEVTPDNFEEIVIKGGKNDNKALLILEFYSPLCGACQDFAPKFKQIMETLTTDGKFEVARFDVTHHDVPKVGEDHGITVEGTPDLYLIQHTNGDGGGIQVQHYKGEPEVDPLLKWIKEESSL